MNSSLNLNSVFDTQAFTLLICRRIEIIKRLLDTKDYPHIASYCFLRKELKRQQALRDKARRIVKQLIDKEYLQLSQNAV